MTHERKPIEITDIFPVGKRLKAYVKDGMSLTMGLWSMEVMALNLSDTTITVRLSQDWNGADTRGGQYWSETREIKLDDLMIPILSNIGGI